MDSALQVMDSGIRRKQTGSGQLVFEQALSEHSNVEMGNERLSQLESFSDRSDRLW